MELALYEPRVGYYAGAGVGPGPQGDYLTSPELHGGFGGLVCAQLEELWRLLGEPQPFWLIEGGPGTGRLAADVLAVAETAFPRFARALCVGLIERNPRLEARQRERLASWGERVRWLPAAPEAWGELGEGCVLANELLDNLPVHRLAGTPDGIRERLVDVVQGSFVEVEGPVSSPDLVEQMRAGGGDLPPGCLGEVGPQGPAWVAATTRLLHRGYVIIVDYGDPADRLYGPERQAGTLRAYRDHVLVRDLLALPGFQDITAHVDISAIERAAAGAGLQPLGWSRQRAFLDRLGLQVLLERVGTRVAGRPAQRAHRTALELLADPEDGFGNLAVLWFGKQAPTRLPSGLGGVGTVVPPDVPAIWRVGELD